MSHDPNVDGYDRWSAFYDSYPNPTVAIDERHLPALYREWRGLKILELGCGSGRHTVRLAAQGNRVLAVDASPGMLAAARRKLDSGPVHIVEADLLVFEPPRHGHWAAPYDVVFESLVLEHIADLPVLCTRIAGWLKPGGIFLASEIHPLRAASGIQAHFKNSNGEEVSLASTPHPPDALVEAAREAGLVCVEQITVQGDAALTALNPKWGRHLGQPMIEICRFVKD